MIRHFAVGSEADIDFLGDCSHASDAAHRFFGCELFGEILHIARKGHDPVGHGNTDICMINGGFPFEFGHHVVLQLAVGLFHHLSPEHMGRRQRCEASGSRSASQRCIPDRNDAVRCRTVPRWV
jgi:hypothetical protein